MSNIKKNIKLVKILCGIIFITMLTASTLQLCSPWLYISDTFSASEIKMRLYNWLY